MKNLVKIDISNKWDLSIYKEKDFFTYFNSYNTEFLKEIDKFEKLNEQGYFLVPYIINNTGWGYEKVFLPFSNKLFKVLNVGKANTSLQFHALKNEQYISLNDDTKVFDGNQVYKLRKNNLMIVPKNTVHQQQKGSLVFEEQDNVLFDSNETIRIYDELGRKINSKDEYLKYFLPQYIDKIQFYKKYSNFDEIGYDKFVFIIDGYVEIDVNHKIVILDKKEGLYFINNKVLIKKIVGSIYITKCEYYSLKKYD